MDGEPSVYGVDADGSAPNLDFVHLSRSAGDPEKLESETQGSTAGAIRSLFRRSKDLVEAEIGWLRARAGYVGSLVQTIAAFAVAAALLVVGIIVTIMIGSMLALAPIVGLGLALLVVVAVAAVLVGLCIFVIKGRIALIADMPK